MRETVPGASGALLSLVLALATTAHGAASDDAPLDLAAGIRQVKGGEVSEAVVTLDTVARRLSGEGDRSGNLWRAYTYLGVAYLLLGQNEAAQERFRQAWEIDGTRAPAASEFPRNAVELYATVRAQAEAERDRRERRPEGRALLIGGAALAGGLGTAAALGAFSKEAELVLTGTWSGTVEVSTFQCVGGVTCPGDTESVVWNLTQTGATWVAAATHRIVSYPGPPVCTDGNALPPIGFAWTDTPRGRVSGSTLLRDNGLERIWGGCGSYSVNGTSITSQCTLSQSGCTFSQTWNLARQ